MKSKGGNILVVIQNNPGIWNSQRTHGSAITWQLGASGSIHRMHMLLLLNKCTASASKRSMTFNTCIQRKKIINSLICGVLWEVEYRQQLIHFPAQLHAADHGWLAGCASRRAARCYVAILTNICYRTLTIYHGLHRFSSFIFCTKGEARI